MRVYINFDPQGNTSTSLGVDNYKSPTIYDVLHGGVGIQAAIHETGIVNLNIVTSNILTEGLP